jgi:hypothetical protein
MFSQDKPTASFYSFFHLHQLVVVPHQVQAPEKIKKNEELG